jgi:MFS family permease
MPAILVKHRRASRAAITALFLGNGLLFGGWATNIPRVRLEHGLTDTALGTLLLCFGGGAVAAMALTGAFAAKAGAGRVATVASLLLALLFPLLAVVPVWPLLLGLGILLGALSGTVDVAMNAYASLLEQRWGGAIMSSLHAGWSAGGLAGAILSGALAGLGWGLLETLAAACAVVAILGIGGATLPPLHAPVPQGRAFRLPSRALMGASVMAALCFACEGSVADWSGVYLNTVVGTDTAWATTGYTAFATTMVAGRLAGDAAVRRFGPARVVRLGGALALAGLGVALAVPDRWAVDAGLMAVGAGLSNVVPIVFSTGGRLGGTAGVAMISGMGFAGLLVAPPLIGNTADAFGLRPALTLVLAGVLGLTLLARSVKR